MKDFLHQLTGIIEANLTNDQFGVTELAREAGMSRSNLHRKVKSASNLSVSQFMCQVRIEKAKEWLLQGEMNVSETAYACGFHSVSYFTKCFNEHMGISPGEYKKQAGDLTENKLQTRTGYLATKSRKKKLILLIFMAAISLALLGVLIIRQSKNNIVDKSIAIAPFSYISDDSQKQYLAVGMMEAILHHLSKIEDLRVLPGNALEGDLGKETNAVLIGKQLNVAYLLQGSFQKNNDQINLNVRLIRTKDGRLVWSNEYTHKWTNVFLVQSQVARRIASELDAAITPEEQLLIDRPPTFSLTAYDFYQRGREEYRKHQMNNMNRRALNNAEQYFREALRHDAGYAEAYAGLAEVYKNRNRGREYFNVTFLDSMLQLANKALEYDARSEQAYAVKGLYYWYKGDREEALKNYDKALQLNPNLWEAYRGKGTLFIDTDLAISIANYQNAASLARGSDLKMVLSEMVNIYLWGGFLNEAERFNEETYRLFGDSLAYLTGQGAIARQRGNIDKSISCFLGAHSIDPGYYNIIWFFRDVTRQLAFLYSQTGQYEKSLEYFRKWLAILDENREITYNAMHRIGYAYWKNGYKDEASRCFDLQLQYCNNLIESGHVWAQSYYTYYDRAGVYAFRGNREEAYKDLEIFNKLERPTLWMVQLIKHDPLFEKVRHEPHFQSIIEETEQKYRADHQRVALLLKKWGYLDASGPIQHN